MKNTLNSTLRIKELNAYLCYFCAGLCFALIQATITILDPGAALATALFLPCLLQTMWGSDSKVNLER